MSLSTSNSKQPFCDKRPTLWLIVGAIIFVFIGSYFLLRAVYYRPNWQSLAVVSINQQDKPIETLVLGSSRVHFGIDPSQYESRLLSLPANYMNAVVMSDVWERYQHKLADVKVVVMEMDIVTLLYDTLAVSPYATISLGLSPWPSGSDAFYQFDASVHRLLWPFFLWRLTPKALQTFQADYSSLHEPKNAAPGFIPSDVKLAFSEAKIEADLPRARAELDKSRPGILPANKAAMRRLMTNLSDQGRGVLLLRFPREASLQQVYPQEWDLLVAESLKEWRSAGLQFDYADFSKDNHFETADFRDPDHLNRQGAMKLAQSLGLLIKKAEAARTKGSP